MASSDPHDNHKIFEKAWNDRDYDTLEDLYEDDATYVASSDVTLQGRPAIRGMLEQMVPMGRNRMELIHLTVAGDIALERTRWTMIAEDEDGKEVESHGLSTVVLRKQSDGTWRMWIDDPGLAGA